MTATCGSTSAIEQRTHTRTHRPGKYQQTSIWEEITRAAVRDRRTEALPARAAPQHQRPLCNTFVFKIHKSLWMRKDWSIGLI